jgi:hypothetical protein
MNYRIARRQLMGAAAAAFAGIGRAGAEEEISRAAESIHQEPVFHASRKRVYEVLLDAKQFTKVGQLSRAMQAGMSLGNKSTEISWLGARSPSSEATLWAGTSCLHLINESYKRGASWIGSLGFIRLRSSI